MGQVRHNKGLEKNIWKYYVMRISAKRLVWPILTIFLVRNQLTPSEIGIIFSVGTIAGLICEVPGGMITDRIGRRYALTFAFLGQALSMLLLWKAIGFVGFLIGNALYYVAGSLMTGTTSAFIYETLHELGREKELKKIVGRGLFLSQVVTGILFTIIPIIATYSLRLPFLLNTFVFLTAAGFTLSFVEPRRVQSIVEQEIGKGGNGFKVFFSNSTLLSLSLALGFLGGINGILEDFRQVYLDFIHIDIAYFGLIYLALRVFTGTLGTQADFFEKHLGRKGALMFLPLISLVTYIGLFACDSLYGLLFVVLDGIMSGLNSPFEQEYLQRMITHANRVTLLSIDNMIQGIIRAGATFAGGLVIGRFGIQTGFLFAALLVIALVLPFLTIFIRRGTRAGLFT